MLLMIDNYDSFTYNLVQYFGELGEEVRVFRNDQITLEGIAALKPDRLVLSPGPCSPAEAGICIEAIRHFAGKLPILGVCLGHQAIGAALGGRIVRAQAADAWQDQRHQHRRARRVCRAAAAVHGEPLPLAGDRARQSCRPSWRSAPRREDGEIMGVRHRELAGTATPLEGVQFHPESILSEHGHAMLKNFLEAMTRMNRRPAQRHRHAADAGDARRDGARRAGRRRLRRRPDGQRAAGAHRRAARQGGGAVHAHRHAEQPGAAS